MIDAPLRMSVILSNYSRKIKRKGESTVKEKTKVFHVA